MRTPSDVAAALDQGLTITCRPKLMPLSGFDDRGQYLPISRLIKGTTLCSAYLRELCGSGVLEAVKVRGVWHVRVKSFAAWVDRYRHQHCKSRRGKRWTAEEKAALAIGGVVGRTCVAQRVMRCRVKKGEV